jgi:nucleoside-diphosphate-sugar epimerase
MTIAVLGATGVIGANLVPLLLGRGHAVRGIVRDETKSAGLRAAGADIAIADLFDRDALARAFDGCDIVVNAASAVPRPGSSDGWDANTRIRTDGTRAVIVAAATAGVSCVIHQSIAMVHQSAGDAWVDEDSPLIPHPQTRSAIDLEAIVSASDMNWQIVRGGLFYGPGTGREDHYRAAARSGDLVLPGDGSDYVSFVHIADMAAAIAAVTQTQQTRRAWLAVDDRPVTWREFLGHICALEDAALPTRRTSNYLPSFRCANGRLRAIGWRPRFHDIAAGIV